MNNETKNKIGNTNVFTKYARVLWGRHLTPQPEGKIFILGKEIFSNIHQQIPMPLNEHSILGHLQNNAKDHDFFITPAIYNDSIRSYLNICGLYCFWAEFDYGSVGHKKHDLPFPSKDQCIKTLARNYQSSGLKPSIIMSSGHGIHCYWSITSNIIEQLTKKQVEQTNEWLYQIGLGINRHYYNEVKSITSLMRSPFPAVNRKIPDCPVPTKMNFTHIEYSLEEIRSKVAAVIIPYLRKNKPKRQIIEKTDVKRNGNIYLIETDREFIAWLADSRDLSYYKSSQYYFDSTSSKEAWIFKYLYLCQLDIPEIYDFCSQHMERTYHVFRTRNTVPERLKRIKYEIDLALKKGTFPKKIKDEHRQKQEDYE